MRHFGSTLSAVNRSLGDFLLKRLIKIFNENGVEITISNIFRYLLSSFDKFFHQQIISSSLFVLFIFLKTDNDLFTIKSQGSCFIQNLFIMLNPLILEQSISRHVFCFLPPTMLLYLTQSYSLVWVDNQYFLYQVLNFFRNSLYWTVTARYYLFIKFWCLSLHKR